MIEPNILAFQNADVLSAIEDAPHGQWNVTDLANHVGRDDSNLGKTLRKLTAEGILCDPPLSGLTQEGHSQLAAFRRAKHGGERRKAKGRWPLDRFRRNPENRKINPEKVLGLADTIVAVGDILLPLVVSPPDEDGIRMIWAGERRWMAATRLAQLGELPEALLEGLPFNERAANKGQAAVVTLIENIAREDMNPWQEAQQMLIAAEEEGLNATELARTIGKGQDGDRSGVRDVQVKLKVAREATQEAIATYEADPEAPGAWEILRNSVSTPKPKPAPEIVTTKAQRLALAELFDKAEGEVGARVDILPAAHAAEGDRLSQYGLAVLTRNDKGDTAQVTRAGADYLQAEGLTGHIANIREQLGIPPRHGHIDYTTAWLNTPMAKPPAADPEIKALAGIAPVTLDDMPLSTFVQGQPYARRFDRHNPKNTVKDYAPHLDWTIEKSEQLDAFLAAREVFDLPHPNPQSAKYSDGYPRCHIEIAQLEGGRGWIYAAGYSTTEAAHHERLTGLWPDKEAFPDRSTALAAGVDLITSSLGSFRKWKLPADIIAWLANPTPADPLVVNGVRHPNLTRANEARRAAGVLPRQSNSGGGAQRAQAEGEPDHPKAVIDCPVIAPEWRLPWVSFFAKRDDQGRLGYQALVRHGFAQTFEPTAFVTSEAEALDQQAMHVSHWFGERLPADVRKWLDGLQTPDDIEAAQDEMAVAFENSDEQRLAPLDLIRLERERQIEAEGWTADHDDEVNGDRELASAAAAYAAAAADDPDCALNWPSGWNPYGFKPTGTIRDLVKAGALILAEIERRQRAGVA